jgi:hypothetical protein
MLCVYHSAQAEYVCSLCGRMLCERCTKLMTTDVNAARVCPECGGFVRPLKRQPRNVSDQSFWYYATTALAWPLSLRGLVVVVINAAFLTLLLGFAYAVTVSPMGALLSLFVVMFAYGYVFLLFLRVVQQTALGEQDTPSTPDVEGLGDAFMALFRVLVVLLVWIGPALIAYHAAEQQATAVFWVLAVLGAAFLPMSLLAVATFESLRGVNPLPLFTAILRVPGQYAVCTACFFAVIGLRYVLLDLDAITGLRLVDVSIKHLAFVYSLYVAGRLLGGLHAANSLRFGWVRA